MITKEQARDIKRTIRSWLPLYEAAVPDPPKHDLKAATANYRPTHRQLGRAVSQMRASVKPARLAVKEFRKGEAYSEAEWLDDVVTAIGDLIESGEDEVMVDHYAHKDDDLKQTRRGKWRFE